MELNQLSDELLAAELERRKQAREAQKRADRKAKVTLVLEHRDTLVKLMTHSRRSCVEGRSVNSSYHPEHGCAECNLCALLDLDEWEEDVQIDVSISLSRVSR